MVNGRDNLGIVLASLLLAIGLVVAALVVIRGFERVRGMEASVLDVTGSADRVVTSDQVKWVGGFSRRVDSTSLDEGYRRMSDDLDEVLDVLADDGFDRDDLTIRPVTVNGVYRECFDAGPDCVREVIAYELEQWFTLSSDQVDTVTQLAQDAQPFVDAGLNYQTISLEYFYSELAAARPELLAEAIRDAQLRAEAIASATGSRVGHLRSADSGVFQVTQLNSTEVSSFGMYDTSTIEKRITAVVHASFALR
ncbi:MAG TPA: SIMPL domain-containing protein [Trueperaceae bacterium]|nr:SIMPL domain-containing protein [Trueperaceae bacterium]